MTLSDDVGEPVEPMAQPPGRTQTRRLRWWISGITFVVGFVFGVVAVGLLNLTTPTFGTAGCAGCIKIRQARIACSIEVIDLLVK